VIRARCIARVMAVLLAGVGSGPAFAATCAVSSSGVNFGNYDPLSGAETDSAGTIRLRCDEPVSATIALSSGNGSIVTRTMSNGTSQLSYNLYTNAQRIVVWGDGTGGSDTVTVQGDTVDYPIYGVVASRQRVTAGSYTDTITLTVSY
jgi:spore coat protein U-like protein